jgi:phage shock protein C
VKRLYRSHQSRIIGGVCGGMAEYFAVDPTLVRLAWILTIFLGGAGLLGYAVAWVIVPPRPEGGEAPQWEEPVRENPPPVTGESGGGHGARSFGIILVVLGGLMLVRNLSPWWGWSHLWPVVLVLLGAWIIVSAVRGQR